MDSVFYRDLGFLSLTPTVGSGGSYSFQIVAPIKEYIKWMSMNNDTDFKVHFQFKPSTSVSFWILNFTETNFNQRQK